MPGGLTLLASANADIPTPAAGKATIFFSLTSGVPSYKDDAGVVHALGTNGATGATGPSGPPLSFTLDDSIPDFFFVPGPAGAAGSAGSTALTAVIKAANETVNNSSTLQNDDELVLSVAANSTYIFEAMFMVQNASNNNGDFKFAWAIPTSATLDEIGFGLDLAAAALTTLVAIAGVAFTAPVTAARSFGVFTGSNVCPIYVRGTLRTGSTAGSLQLQWAQNTADPTNTVLFAGSHLQLLKVS